MSSKEKLVEVYQSTGEMEAQVIKSLLESDGIPCLLQSQTSPSVHVGIDKVKVMVWDSIAERARELIAGEDNV